MKKLLTIIEILAAFVASGCRVGTYAHSGGMDNESYIVVTATEEYDITIVVDGTSYATKTVEQKRYRSRRDVKDYAERNIRIAPGQHNVTVQGADGKELYRNTIYLSTNETKNIKL